MVFRQFFDIVARMNQERCLVIQNTDKSVTITLQKDGDIKASKPISTNVTDFTPNGTGLVISYEGDTKAMIDNDGLHLKDEVHTVTEKVPDALYIAHKDNESTDIPQAALDKNGALNISGKSIVKGMPVKTVAKGPLRNKCVR